MTDTMRNIKQYLKNHEKHNGKYAIEIRWRALGINPDDYENYDELTASAHDFLREWIQGFKDVWEIDIYITGRSNGWLELQMPIWSEKYVDGDIDALTDFDVVSAFDLGFEHLLIEFKDWLETEYE